MTIHVVKKGETLSGIASSYGVSENFLAIWNAISEPYTLVVGQALLILTPSGTYTVRAGDTIASIAARFGTTARELFANNPNLYGGILPIFQGQTLVLGWEEKKTDTVRINSYAYPFITDEALYGTLPYLTFLSPFTYGFTPQGELIPLDDERLILSAFSYGASPLMHLSTLTKEGTFSNELASAVLRDNNAADTLISNILENIQEKDYYGLDIDFEYVLPADAAAYAAFIEKAKIRLNEAGYPVIAALVPKSSRDQPGAFYEGHDYAAIGAAANAVFVMTYEWVCR